MDHIGLGEDTATAGDPWRGFAFQSQFAELAFDIDTKAGRLLIEEAASASGTIGVHGEIDHIVTVNGTLRVAEKDDFAVLTAHLDQRPGFRMQMPDGGRLTYKFVDEIDIQQLAQCPAGTAGTSHGSDAVRWYLAKQIREYLTGCFHGPTVSPLVMQISRVCGIVQKSQFTAYRTNVDTKMQRSAIRNI